MEDEMKKVTVITIVACLFVIVTGVTSYIQASSDFDLFPYRVDIEPVKYDNSTGQLNWK